MKKLRFTHSPHIRELAAYLGLHVSPNSTMFPESKRTEVAQITSNFCSFLWNGKKSPSISVTQDNGFCTSLLITNNPELILLIADLRPSNPLKQLQNRKMTLVIYEEQSKTSTFFHGFWKSSLVENSINGLFYERVVFKKSNSKLGHQIWEEFWPKEKQLNPICKGFYKYSISLQKIQKLTIQVCLYFNSL